MDSARFDHLARLAATGSRRAILRAVIAVSIVAPMKPARSTLAQEGVVVVGGACAATADCRQVDMQRGAICADGRRLLRLRPAAVRDPIHRPALHIGRRLRELGRL